MLGEERIRAARRRTLEIRTITVSLRIAMDELEANHDLPLDRRIALRREWCARANQLLADVRGRTQPNPTAARTWLGQLTAAEEEIRRQQARIA